VIKKYKDVDIEAVACVHNLQYSSVQYSSVQYNHTFKGQKPYCVSLGQSAVDRDLLR